MTFVIADTTTTGFACELGRNDVDNALKGGDVADRRAAKFHHCWTAVAQFSLPIVSVPFYDSFGPGSSGHHGPAVDIQDLACDVPRPVR